MTETSVVAILRGAADHFHALHTAQGRITEAAIRCEADRLDRAAAEAREIEAAARLAWEAYYSETFTNGRTTWDDVAVTRPGWIAATKFLRDHFKKPRAITAEQIGRAVVDWQTTQHWSHTQNPAELGRFILNKIDGAE